MKKVILLVIFSGLCYNLRSQDTNIIKYFPLAIGNVWIYHCEATGMACHCSKMYKFKIVNTTIKNGKYYFVFQYSSFNIGCYQGECYGGDQPLDSIRIDTLTGQIFRYNGTNYCSNSPFEVMKDSLYARLNDTVRNNCGISPYRYLCYDTTTQNIFGNLRKTKAFAEVQFETGYRRKFAHGIGIINYGYGTIVCSMTSNLIGCVIDGIVYGDTSFIIGIAKISSEVPETFSLSQNYPNPFNPTTKIKFAVPTPSPLERVGVRLIIYDILGREVTTLVNEQLQPGTYEVEFPAPTGNGTDFSSGIYYYQLMVSNEQSAQLYRETRKMILIK